MPKLSIITPVFNGARFISDCIENVRAQGFDDLEHLIIDGDSSDGTQERVAELASLYPHLRLVSEKDRGQSDAMNKGIRLAKGEIIGFLNVDDFYEPGAINEAMAFLDRHPKVDFVAGDCRILDETGTQITINTPSDLRLESLLLGWWYAQYPGNPSSYFYKKSIHSLVGEYDVSDHNAMDLSFILACAAKVRMAYVPRLWGNFRLMPGTKTYADTESGLGVRRTQKLRSQWIESLSPFQRFRMRVIKIQKRVLQIWYVQAVLRRLTRLLPLRSSDSPWK